MSNGITRENLLWTLPYALQQDKDKTSLATVIADELTALYRDNRLLALYTRIDELDEALLDILAKDFHVLWYLYDGTLEAKRAQIKSCFYVHRKLGTKAAMVTALSDICPGSEVNEWFDYGGDPYHFRVILDVTEQVTPINHSMIENYINIFKSLRSVLEENTIIYRSRNTVLVGVTSNYVLYSIRICGTYPEAAVQGRIQKDTLSVSEEGDFSDYMVPATGTLKVGTYPTAAVQGRIQSDLATVSEGNGSTEYTVPVTGTIPVPAVQGDIGNGAVSMESSGGSASYNSRMCGTPLGSLI